MDSCLFMKHWTLASRSRITQTVLKVTPQQLPAPLTAQLAGSEAARTERSPTAEAALLKQRVLSSRESVSGLSSRNTQRVLRHVCHVLLSNSAEHYVQEVFCFTALYEGWTIKYWSGVRDRPIFCRDLQIRTFGGLVGLKKLWCSCTLLKCAEHVQVVHAQNLYPSPSPTSK